MLSCRDVTRRVSGQEASTDGFWTRLEVRLHLMMCRHCRRYERQLQAIARTARALGRHRAPTTESVDRVRDRILQRFGSDSAGRDE